MSVATAAPAGNPAGQQQKPPPLWGEIEIPIIVGTGEFGQGKTVFGLSICPGAQTLVYDNEGSSLSYRSIGFSHVDMAAELARKYPNGYTALNRYEWWRADAINRGRSGKFRVLMVDPASEIEDGLAEHVRKNARKFNLTEGQIAKSPGLFWGAMKRAWQQDLDFLRTFYECVYLVVHMRDEFKGNGPTGKREPKGKETLFQLASLFLQFERPKDATGQVSAIPAAKVLKSRLAKPVFTADGELQIVPVLPPRMPTATPLALRRYIAQPPDYSKLAPDELDPEKQMTEAEKLQMQAQIAADTRAAAEAEVSRLERMNQVAAAQQAAREQAAANHVPAPDQAAQYAASRQRQASPDPYRAELRTTAIGLAQSMFDSPESFQQWLIEGYEVSELDQMDEGQLRSVVEHLQAIADSPHQDPHNQPTAEEATLSPAQQMLSDAVSPGPVTEEQCIRLRELVDLTGWPVDGDDGQEAWCAARGFASPGDVDCVTAQGLIEHLEVLEKIIEVAPRAGTSRDWLVEQFGGSPFLAETSVLQNTLQQMLAAELAFRGGDADGGGVPGN